jgi:TPR repeat protein
MYKLGRGVPKDPAKAVEWYRKAAEQGLATAQYDLGNMYNVGRGVPKDQTKAMEWYKKAVDQGDESAKNALDKLEG